MSSIWTPGGERPVNTNQSQAKKPRPPQGTHSGAPAGAPAGPPASPPFGQAPGVPSEDMPDEETLAQLREELAQTPANIIVANHCFGLFELAALHLSQQPPQLEEARVAIDALAAIVTTLQGRLGEVEPQLVEGVSQLKLAFVKIRDMDKDPGASA